MTKRTIPATREINISFGNTEIRIDDGDENAIVIDDSQIDRFMRLMKITVEQYYEQYDESETNTKPE